MKIKSHQISIIMPVHNGESTLPKALESLLCQSRRFDELIIVDDASSDDSIIVVKECLNERDYKFIKNERCHGLAAAYNRGIKISKGDLIITLHQDVVLERDSLERLIAPFSNDRVVAASHVVVHPLDIWKKYNFWQKCFFSRLVGKNFSGIDGKFDAFRKSALEKAGLFDEKHFRTAGEDSDMVCKLERIGKISETQAEIIHLHKIDPRFSWKEIIRKQAQYSEAQGTLLRLGRLQNIKTLAKAFFREILILALLFSYLRIVSVVLILLYSFLYTKLVYLNEYKNGRILVLPFFNIFLLFVSIVYSTRGFIYGKQRI